MIYHGRMVKTGRIYISKSLELLEKQCPHKKNKGRCGTASRVWVLLGNNRWSQDVTLSSIVYKLYIKSGIYCCPELCAAELVFFSQLTVTAWPVYQVHHSMASGLKVWWKGKLCRIYDNEMKLSFCCFGLTAHECIFGFRN